MAYLVARRLGDRLDERGGRDDLPRCAEAALERVGADERLHEGMVAQPFDGRHLALADGVDQRDARERGRAVEQHGAGAAVSLAARDLRPRQAELAAEDVEQRGADRRAALVTV